MRPSACLAVAVSGALVLAGAANGAVVVSTLGTTGTLPASVALDAQGNAYTTNWGSNSVSKILVGGGAAGAPWPVTVGNGPWGIGIDLSGNVYASNTNSDNVSKLSPAGAVAGTFTTETGPLGLTVDASGNVYTANFFGTNSNSITRVSAAGAVTNPFATAATGGNPWDVALDPAGNLFTVDLNGDSVTKFTALGTPAGAPWPVSLGAGALPRSVTTDWQGNVYTANEGSDTVSQISLAGSVTHVALAGADNPQGLTLDSAGNIYTANRISSSVTKVTPNGVASTLASSFPLNGPQDITIDADGRLYVANYSGNNVIRITGTAGEIAAAPPAAPSAPTAVAGTAAATVTVPANPADKRYGVPTSYTVTAVEDPSRTCTVTVPATSCQVTGLTNGTAYTFTAKAVLNAWQTAASPASGSITPAAPQAVPFPTPIPDPNDVVPFPTPIPSSIATPTSNRSPAAATVRVAGLKVVITPTRVRITSRVAVSGAGSVLQVATTARGAKRITRCRGTRVVSAAGTAPIACNLDTRGRAALRKGALKLRVLTTFTPRAGAAVSSARTITATRRR